METILCTGYFSTLNMEFGMRNENISVTIMPLPYVLTDRAVKSMKIKSNIRADSIGITSEVSLVITLFHNISHTIIALTACVELWSPLPMSTT